MAVSSSTLMWGRCAAAFSSLMLGGCDRLFTIERHVDALQDIGHDEDNDGVGDAGDLCPHLEDDQADVDGDGVGDACDPEPALPRQRIAMFDPMSINSPFSTDGFGDGTWTQGDDGWHYDGAYYGDLIHNRGLDDVDLWFSIDVLSVKPGDRQISLAVEKTTVLAPFYLGEIVDTGSVDAARIVYVTRDPDVYTPLHAVPVPDGIRPGRITFHLAARTAATGEARISMTVAWPGEPYLAMYETTTYTGANLFRLTFLHVEATIHSVTIITTKPAE